MSLLDDASLLVTPNAEKAGKLYSIIPTNGNGDFSVTRATTATRTNSSGLIESTPINEPRLDYSLGSCPNILLEPQRTNNSRWSEDLTQSIWTKNSGVTITADNTISPSGVQNADRVIGATGAAIWAMPNTLNQSIGSLPSSTICTITIYLRSSTTSSQVTLVLRDQTTGNTTSLVCNLTSSWQRFEISRTTGALTTALGVVLGAATADFFAWGLQGEAGAYATSYIPTTSASVTRNADVISRGNIFTNGLITSSGGTWFVDLRNNKSYIRDAALSELYLGEDGSSFSAGGKQAIAIRNNGGTSTPMYFAYWNGSVILDSYSITPLNPKIAIKFTATTYDLFVNGVKVLSARPISWTLSNVQFLNKLLGTTQYINSMALFPTPLTDTQCIALTTL
jgi:hypothetical protein